MANAFAVLKAHDTRQPRTLVPADEAGNLGQVRLTETGVFSGPERRGILADLRRIAPHVMENETVRGRVVARRTAIFAATSTTSVGYAGVHKRKVTRFGRTCLGRVVNRVRKVVQKRLDTQVDTCVLNFYPDGNAGIGQHSDDPRSFAPNTSIISVSFGDTRDMVFKPKKGNSLKGFTVALPSGSMVEMVEPLQAHWTHGIPPRKNRADRFNMTFRVANKA